MIYKIGDRVVLHDWDYLVKLYGNCSDDDDIWYSEWEEAFKCFYNHEDYNGLSFVVEKYVWEYVQKGARVVGSDEVSLRFKTETGSYHWMPYEFIKKKRR